MFQVLLCDDEPSVTNFLKSSIAWESLGIQNVYTASDGREALSIFEKRQIDLLITDIRMPFMDGLSLSKLVMEEQPDIKIIILSGYDDFEYAQQAIKIGVEQYLLKPITKATLVHVLQEV